MTTTTHETSRGVTMRQVIQTRKSANGKGQQTHEQSAYKYCDDIFITSFDIFSMRVRPHFSTCKMTCDETTGFENVSTQVILHVLKRCDTSP